VKLLRVGELAEKTGKTRRAIRFYEELGLLVPTRRTKGGFRLYGASALVRIHWIDRLQELGFTLPEIGKFLAALHEQEHGPAAMDDLRAFYASKLQVTQELLKRVQALETELQESLRYLSACTSCAPDTHRSACRNCEAAAHSEGPQPVLVAAIHAHG
jgi:MerR family mercuric resistance operon transcriptional regulator